MDNAINETERANLAAYHTFDSIMFESWANDVTISKAADRELREVAYNVLVLGVMPAASLVATINELEEKGYAVIEDNGAVDITMTGCWALGL